MKRLDRRTCLDLMIAVLWISQFALFFLPRLLIPAENYHLVHHPLDDLIPLWTPAAIPYYLWYIGLVGTPLYTFFKDREAYRSYIYYALWGYGAAIVVYMLYPTAIAFRPDGITGDDIFTRMVAFIYTIDTPTNVLPSLHVTMAAGIALGLGAAKPFRKPLPRLILWLFALSVAASTVLIKQHSVLDTLAAAPVCLIGGLLFFRKKKNKPQD